MEIGTMTKGIMGVLVMIILVVTVAIPIISDVNSGGDTAVTGTNTGQLYNMNVITDGSEVVWTYIGPGQYSVNDETYTTEGTTWADANVLFAEGIIVTINASGAIIQTDKTKTITAAVGDTVTCSGGTWTLHDASASQDYMGSYTTVAFRDDDGDYGYWTITGVDVNVSDDSRIYGFLRSDSSKPENESLCTYVSGTIGDLAASGGWTYSDRSPTTPTGSITVTTTIQEESEYYDTVSSRISISYGGASYTTNLVAPLEYTEDITRAEGAVHTIIDVVPILLVVGILLGVITLFVTRAE